MRRMRFEVLGFLALLIWPAGFACAAETTVTVGRADADFTSIQAAVDRAAGGTTVVVRAGVYREHVRVDKPLTLRGEGAVVVDAGKNGSAIILAGSGIELSGFEVRNAGSSGTDAGLLVLGDGNTLSHIRATENHRGIVVSGGRENDISDSEASGNRNDGVALLGASATGVTRNTLSGNGRAGIWLEAIHADQSMLEAAENRIFDNSVRANKKFGIALNSGAVRNEIDGNRVEANGRQTSDAGILINCGPNGNLVRENVVSGNQKHGILIISGSFANRVLDNAVTGSATGIGIYDANTNEIAGNSVRGSADYGIRLDDMAPLMGKAANVPGMAGAFPVSAQNILHHNDLVDNRINAFDLSGKPWTPPGAEAMPPALLESMGNMLAPNRWDDGKEGNHYDDFDEEREGFIDRNEDGIGDAAHAIPGGAAVDNFPLKTVPTSD
ncbi:parallel beta-helix repeat protein [Ciceribacter lividus]|uniref:Parallel beta-helix repeat protein n=1 Tax=Ciceribacter lividus TaxID=1197950 RepID=A0A6I7HJM9_9HYPH|nr:NosD domain-containing protein [Ciceribacter lividus]RCW20220.1 parallel beta-helix repeat protein [Ciceribacter lividus]